MSETPETLNELVELRRDQERPIQVFVTGAGQHEPSFLVETARDISEHIVPDDGTVVEDDFGTMDESDVALLEISVGRDQREADLQQLRELAATARAKSLAGIVAYDHTPDVPNNLLRVLDARIEIGVDGVESAHMVQFDSFNDDVYLNHLDWAGV